jgi:hypothetical protein
MSRVNYAIAHVERRDHRRLMTAAAVVAAMIVVVVVQLGLEATRTGAQERGPGTAPSAATR